VPGKSITTVQRAFPAERLLAQARHAGAVTVYVLSGTIRSQLGGGPVGTFRAGDSFFEPPGAIHLFAENASLTEPAEILAIFVAEDCAQLTTYED
jgi:quercetin dioxygenase-like cupin family protein